MNVLLAAVAGIVMFAAARLLVGRREVARLERRVQAHVQIGQSGHVSSVDGNRVRRLLDDLERSVSRREWWDGVVARLERAGIERRPVDIVALLVTATAAVALLSAAAGSFVLALLIVAAVPCCAWLVLGTMAQRRIRAFDQQLPDLLGALSSSLRAGHGFLQSLQAVAYDAPAPAGPELRRALAETRLGRPVEEALAGVAARVPSKDFSYVLTAVSVQRQVGGSLASLFETVNETVRQRQQFARKVRALTSTGRASAYSLVALPFGVAFLLSLVNRSYLMPMFTSSTGRLMLLFGLGSLLIGTFIVRRIVSFKG